MPKKITYQDKTNKLPIIDAVSQATAEDFNHIKEVVNDHADAIDKKLDFVSVPRIIDDLTTPIANAGLSANQGLILKNLIDNIWSILTSDDTNLDELQEVVDFIKQNKEDLQNLTIPNIAGLQQEITEIYEAIGNTGGIEVIKHGKILRFKVSGNINDTIWESGDFGYGFTGDGFFLKPGIYISGDPQKRESWSTTEGDIMTYDCSIPPDLTITTSGTISGDSQVTLRAISSTSNMVFTWTGFSEGINPINVFAQGEYTVKATNTLSGCSAEKTVLITN
ncbi:hypothetical protein AWE51_00255 [Aquimarina aggregata]|uniref:Uncharacterized protein n=1 Tax=Aquimarina aggregata TaxID=1642818 RepID=A0A163BZ61_9FLAO|nr:hypothetical protein [Aquimarina aggregata]KZS41913.1 hypothetical protein AWE51_00255 [Aquimarina aggregata]